MNILGISAFYHDSAAALVQDGDIVAAAQEERFTRKKHDYRFPKHAIDYCLAEADLKAEDIDAVVFYDKPFVKFERLLETYLAFAPRGVKSFLMAMPLWMKQKLHLPKIIRGALGEGFKGPVLFTDHHESHAASAFFPSPFDEAAILTSDGVGEWTTSSFGVGRGNRIELLKEIRFPHSLGLLYSAFTYYTGFKVNSGEYKLMGLAPYGEPRFVDLIKEHLIDIKPDGSFWMNMEYFDYCAGLKMVNRKFEKLFGRPARKPESQLTQHEMDVAASIQKVTEEIMMLQARHVHEVTGMKNLCLAGGVALNCVSNGRILREGPFERIWIQPAAGDAGGALGAALFVWFQLQNHPRKAEPGDAQKGSLLGPAFSDEEVRRFLDSVGAKYSVCESDEELIDRVADAIAEGKVVGWHQGRMEFGPRALGSRSILGDARSKEMQSKMNLKIKYRESFRPFAPSALIEHASEYFDIDTESPYMLLVCPVREEVRIPLTDEQREIMRRDPDLRKRVNIPRSQIPAVTHLDYSARLQTVDAARHGRYHQMITRFREKTGCGVIVNTSFNVRGEPIVCTPEDAYQCFMHTEMDMLAIGRQILLKEDQPRLEGKEKYIERFELD